MLFRILKVYRAVLPQNNWQNLMGNRLIDPNSSYNLDMLLTTEPCADCLWEDAEYRRINRETIDQLTQLAESDIPVKSNSKYE